jgi:cytochrome c oxidase subunit 4
MAHQTDATTHAKSHPGPQQYVIIGVILAILTALEVVAFAAEDTLAFTPWFLVVTLLGLSLAKFIIVVGYFMHLKFDDWRFSFFLVAPLVIMLSITLVLLAIFTLAR